MPGLGVKILGRTWAARFLAGECAGLRSEGPAGATRADLTEKREAGHTVPADQIAVRRQVVALWWLAYLRGQDWVQAERVVVERLINSWPLLTGSPQPSSRVWREIAPTVESSFTDTNGRSQSQSALPGIAVTSADRLALALVLAGHDVPAVAELEEIPVREVHRRLRQALRDLRGDTIVAQRLGDGQRVSSDRPAPADPALSWLS